MPLNSLNPFAIGAHIFGADEPTDMQDRLRRQAAMLRGQAGVETQIPEDTGNSFTRGMQRLGNVVSGGVIPDPTRAPMPELTPEQRMQIENSQMSGDPRMDRVRKAVAIASDPERFLQYSAKDLAAMFPPDAPAQNVQSGIGNRPFYPSANPGKEYGPEVFPSTIKAAGGDNYIPVGQGGMPNVEARSQVPMSAASGPGKLAQDRNLGISGAGVDEAQAAADLAATNRRNTGAGSKSQLDTQFNLGNMTESYVPGRGIQTLLKKKNLAAQEASNALDIVIPILTKYPDFAQYAGQAEFMAGQYAEKLGLEKTMDAEKYAAFNRLRAVGGLLSIEQQHAMFGSALTKYEIAQGKGIITKFNQLAPTNFSGAMASLNELKRESVQAINLSKLIGGRVVQNMADFDSYDPESQAKIQSMIESRPLGEQDAIWEKLGKGPGGTDLGDSTDAAAPVEGASAPGPLKDALDQMRVAAGEAPATGDSASTDSGAAPEQGTQASPIPWPEGGKGAVPNTYYSTNLGVVYYDGSGQATLVGQ